MVLILCVHMRYSGVTVSQDQSKDEVCSHSACYVSYIQQNTFSRWRDIDSTSILTGVPTHEPLRLPRLNERLFHYLRCTIARFPR